MKDVKWVYLPWNVFDLNDDTMHFNTTMVFKKDGLDISYNDKELTDHFQRNFKIKSHMLNFQGNFVVKKYKNHDGHFFAEQILEDDGRFWHAGHKEYGMEITGKGEIGDKQINFDENSTAMMDIQRGVLTFKTSYIWIGIDTVLEDGTRIALNINGGTKQTEKSLNNEDYAVINGKLTLLDPVEYSVTWDHPMIIWSLSTEDIEGPRKVNLQFNPTFQSLEGPN